jgi:glycosyltransferase involved in cell wall biosynthesis
MDVSFSSNKKNYGLRIMSKRLLLVGSNTIHTYNYLDLIAGYFEEVTVVTNEQREGRKEHTILADFDYSLKSLIATRKRIRKELIKFRPSIIHVHQVNSYALYTLMAARGLGIPVILTAWGSDILVAPRRGRLMRKIVSYCLRRADFLTSDSSFMADEMNRMARPKHPILLANFGVETLDLNAQRENVIYSNRLHKKLYNIDLIIRSFAKLVSLSGHGDWKLVVAATGEETESLKELAEVLNLSNHIEFVGWLTKEENAKWYARARFWVSIPDSDATSISLLEAMAYGCIPVVSDLPANREWVINGETGWIVSPDNESCLLQLTGLDEDRARAINRKLIEERGTKTVNRNKFIQLYTNALSQK